jgi:hypothetical protein
MTDIAATALATDNCYQQGFAQINLLSLMMLLAFPQNVLFEML